MKHFFAPVPAVHLESAYATFREHNAVALGSSQYELLLGLNGQPATIWIGASTGYVPPGGVAGINIGKVLYRARFVCAGWCGKDGKPTKPELRPRSTDDDSIWKVFYVVSGLEALDPPLPSAKLRRKGGGKVESAPHMLIQIEDPKVG